MDTHLKLHAAQLKQLTQTHTHYLCILNPHSNPPRNMKATLFHNNENTNIIILDPDITHKKCKENGKHILTAITLQSSIVEKITKLLT